MKEAVKDQKHGKNNIGRSHDEIGLTHPLQDRPVDSPGKNGKCKISYESSREKLSSDSRVLEYTFPFSEQIRDKHRGAVGYAGGTVA
jgi:hypothetical protein